MLLLGALRRPDVFPVDDQVIRSGMLTLYGLPADDKRFLRQALHGITQEWVPYRSYACRYIWLWNDTPYQG